MPDASRGRRCIGGSRGRDTGRITVRGSSAFAGFRFPLEVITVAVRWYLRYGLSYRDVEELLAERDLSVSLVRGRTLRPRQRPVDLLVPGSRSAWPAHRRPAFSPPRFTCSQVIFRREPAAGC
jgi:hypothetical protein